MGSESRRNKILQDLFHAVATYDREASVELSEQAVAEGIPARDALINGLSKGMLQAGRLYDEQTYFVPEILQCSNALNAGVAILKPHLAEEGGDEKITVIMGSVRGDIHDIGRRLVKVMYESAGWRVLDLGSDVGLEAFLEAQAKFTPRVVALSALTTTSMYELPLYIAQIKAHDGNTVTVVGGAPMRPDIARAYGADGYAENCGKAVAETLKAISGIRREEQDNENR